MRPRRRCADARARPPFMSVLAVAFLSAGSLAVPLPTSAPPRIPPPPEASTALAAIATACPTSRVLPPGPISPRPAEPRGRLAQSAASTLWVTKTKHFPVTHTSVTAATVSWLPHKRTPWYQRKALFITSFFLAIVILLVMGAVVVVCDRDRTLHIAPDETEEAATHRVLCARLDREREKDQRRAARRKGRRDRWNRMRTTTKSIVTRPIHLARPSRRHHRSVSGDQHLFNQDRHPSLEDEPASTTLHDSVEAHCASNVSPRWHHGHRTVSSRLHALASDSEDAQCSSCATSSCLACSDSDADTPRPAARSVLSSCASPQPVVPPCAIGNGVHRSSLTDEDRALAQQYILKRIALLKSQLSEWRQLQDETGELGPNLVRLEEEAEGTNSVSQGSLGGSPAPPRPSRRLLAILRRAREAQTPPLETTEEQELFPPAYNPSNSGAASSSPPAAAAAPDDQPVVGPREDLAHQPDQKPPSGTSDPLAPARNGVATAHVATDDKRLLAALREGASHPSYPAEGTAASAPALPNAEGFELRSSRGKVRAVERADASSAALPLPPVRIEPRFSLGEPSRPSTTLPSSDPEKIRLALLMSGPSAPAPLQPEQVPRASAPPLDSHLTASSPPSVPDTCAINSATAPDPDPTPSAEECGSHSSVSPSAQDAVRRGSKSHSRL